MDRPKSWLNIVLLLLTWLHPCGWTWPETYVHNYLDASHYVIMFQKLESLMLHESHTTFPQSMHTLIFPRWPFPHSLLPPQPTNPFSIHALRAWSCFLNYWNSWGHQKESSTSSQSPMAWKLSFFSIPLPSFLLPALTLFALKVDDPLLGAVLCSTGCSAASLTCPLDVYPLAMKIKNVTTKCPLRGNITSSWEPLLEENYPCSCLCIKRHSFLAYKSMIPIIFPITYHQPSSGSVPSTNDMEQLTETNKLTLSWLKFPSTTSLLYTTLHQNP